MTATSDYFDRYEHLLFERREDGVLLMTINRPEVYNATNEVLHRDLSRVWIDIDRDPETRVCVVTGAGKAFSAGGDIGMVQRMAGDYERISSMYREMSDLVYNILACDTPIVSAINGVAVGAGLVVALMADISIIAQDVRLTDGHVRLGVVGGDHAAILWPLLCGMAKAKYYLLTADFLDGAEAERIGLVSKAVPRDEVMDTAFEAARKVALLPADPVRWTKRSLNNWMRQAGPIFDQSAALEMLSFFGGAVKEGSQALVDKREPDFRGM